MNLFIVVCTLGNKSDDLYSSLLLDLSATDRSVRKELLFAIHIEECWWFCRNIYNVGITVLLGAGVELLQRGEINRHEMQPVLEEPIAFKGRITITDFGARINISKIMTLKEAKRETKKVKKEIQEAPPVPINLSVRLDANPTVLDSLYQLINQHRGNRPLSITIVSKLHNVVIDSAIHVDSKILAALEGNADINVLGA